MIFNAVSLLLFAGPLVFFYGKTGLDYISINAFIILVLWIFYGLCVFVFGNIKDIATTMSKDSSGKDELDSSVYGIASSLKIIVHAALLYSFTEYFISRHAALEYGNLALCLRIVLGLQSLCLVEDVLSFYLNKTGSGWLRSRRLKFLRSEGSIIRRIVLSGGAAACLIYVPNAAKVSLDTVKFLQKTAVQLYGFLGSLLWRSPKK